MYRRWVATLLLFGLAACASRPPAAAPWSGVTVIRAEQENLVGQRVHWGGDIASITPGAQDTCFEVISHPLAGNGRPQDTERSDGRFVACAPGVYPHGLYEGRQVTVDGTLRKPIVRKLGPFPSRYPQVAVEQLHFWRAPDANTSWRTPDWAPPGASWDRGSEGYWW
jgi:outer membrane lipoprotein